MQYMAPEVIVRQGYTEKADIWSLGITAIEMFKGSPPLSNLKPFQALLKIPKEPSPKLEDSKSSKYFKEFVELCLQKEPNSRPSAKDLLKTKFIKNAKKNTILMDLVETKLNYVKPTEKAQDNSDSSDDSSDEDEDEDHEEDDAEGTIVNRKWDFGTVQEKKPSKPLQQVTPSPVTPNNNNNAKKAPTKFNFGDSDDDSDSDSDDDSSGESSSEEDNSNNMSTVKTAPKQLEVKKQQPVNTTPAKGSPTNNNNGTNTNSIDQIYAEILCETLYDASQDDLSERFQLAEASQKGLCKSVIESILKRIDKKIQEGVLPESARLPKSK